MKRHHKLPFGAEILEDGRVRFRLWAPGAGKVALRLEDDAVDLAMQNEDGGWFALATDRARAGSRYRFLVDGFAVPDPASRYQPHDVHEASEVVAALAYDWQDAAWAGRPWEEIALYELHVGSFSPEGDFRGVARRLDYLVDLGITAIELMPLADFPGRWNWGYDGVLPFAPDARYGRPEDLKHLIDACHGRGLAVFIDVVYNHFGPEGNYLHRYAPDFFTDRHVTPWGAAINFDGDQAGPVRDFYIENALYWLEEYHADGLRFDAVHAIVDTSPRHILIEIAETVRRRFSSVRPIHLVLENDRNEAWLLRQEGRDVPLFTAQWNDDLHHALHVLATGETAGYYADYADRPSDRLGRALAEGFAYQGEPSAYRDGERRGEPSAALPPTAFVSFIQNHDQVGNDAFGRRLRHRAEPDRHRLVAAIYLLSPQIPLIFMGEECNSAQPFPFFCDFTGELADAVRDGRRREFARFPEFQDSAARAAIPDPCADATFQSAVLDFAAPRPPEEQRWLSWYRGLLALRQREIVPRLRGIGGQSGTYRVLGDQALTVCWRLGDSSQLRLYANFGDAAAACEEGPQGRLLHATGETIADGKIPPRSASFFLT